MRVKLDWLSFSLPFPESTLFNDDQAAVVAADTLASFVGDHYQFMVGEGGMKQESGRRPFSTSYRNPDNSVSVYLNYKLTHFLVELSGKACERMFGDGGGKELLSLLGDRVTRIDIACDILCETDPLDFADARGEGRFKSHSEMVSETGTTYYVGSKKSDRYARVYRYSMPHPRAHLLRVEHVFRDVEAKQAISYYIDNGEEKMAQQCQLMYKWKHPSWEISPASEKELTTIRPDREKANTMFWVYDTVAPLLARLAKEESLSLEDYFNYVWRLSTGLSEKDALDPSTGEML